MVTVLPSEARRLALQPDARASALPYASAADASGFRFVLSAGRAIAFSVPVRPVNDGG